jgi:pyrroloquinoline-quinone synthase
MFVHCHAPDPAQGLGALCLGAQTLAPAIHADILAGFAGCGVGPERLAFFRTHAEGSDGPAQPLRELLARLCAADPVQAQVALQAGRDVASAWLAFFGSIEAAHRRSAQPLWRQAA